MTTQDTRPWVVVAEDDADTLSLLTRQFEKRGCRVTSARSGTELAKAMTSALLDKDNARYPDLLISDVNMPAYSGLEVLQSFRDANCAIPTIIVTGDPAPHTHRTAKRLGAILMPKPLVMTSLLEHADRMLGAGQKSTKQAQQLA